MTGDFFRKKIGETNLKKEKRKEEGRRENTNNARNTKMILCIYLFL